MKRNDQEPELLSANQPTYDAGTAVAVRPQQPLDVARPQPTVADMLQAVITGGVTSENVGAVEKIVALYERMQEKDAEKEFSKAFVALQAEMPNVKAVKAIPGREGSVRSRYAPYEEIMAEVAPMLQRHGFTITFSTDFKEGRIVKTCTLTHVAGHSRSNHFAVRIGSGPPNASEAQADGAASTYAKRFVLCDCLNIVIDTDTDARAEGAPVTKEQADELERRVAETNSDKAAFLKFAGATKFSEIPSTKYSMLDGFLAKKEGRR